MKLRTVKKIVIGLFVLEFALAIAAIWMKFRPAGFACAALVFATAIFQMKYFKCPACGEFLGRINTKRCTHCGEEVFPKHGR